MRKFIAYMVSTVCLFGALVSQAATYYVKVNGNATGTGLDDANAWNYAVLASKRLAAGDTVLLKRGDVFFGALTVRSGMLGSRIHYGAYGSGANPVISGFASVQNWSLYANNVYVTDLSAYNLPVVNLVTLDGSVVGMGRYPNAGYLPYTGHTGNTEISGNAISALPFNATGGEAVIRKVRWILDRQPITSHSGSKLSLSTTSPYGGALSYEAVDKNGFFIQNHLSTLDKEGEWYYDRTTKRLYMVLSSLTKTVKVTVVDKLLTMSSKSHVSFKNIDFEGSNTAAVSLSGCTNVVFTDCNFYRHGQTGIYGITVTDMLVKGGTITDCQNNGLWVEWAGQNVKADSVTVLNSGVIAGAGRSGDAAQEGISIAGNTTTITRCTVRNTGYNGIHFNGNNAWVENNLVDNFCLVKDDGGGIYTFEANGVQVTNRFVRSNTILNAIGAFAGAESNYYEQYGKAAGIYLDGFSNHTYVTSNVIAHGPWAGFFVHSNSDNQFSSNLVFNHQMSILLLESNPGEVRRMVITGNECIARTGAQKTLYVKMFAPDDPALMGTYDLNYYARPLDDSKTISVDRQYANGGGETALTLAQWKATFGVDVASGKSAVSVDNPVNIRFDYNHSPASKTVYLQGSWKDIYSTVYQTSYTISSFRGKVVLHTVSGSNPPILAVNESTFTATENDGLVTLRWDGFGDLSSYFEVERSADGVRFTKIGLVKGSLNDTAASYSFVDREPLVPVNYYRLRVADSKGYMTYTKVVMAKVAGEDITLQAYPNPASSVLNIRVYSHSQAVPLLITDMAGNTVKQFQLPSQKGVQQQSVNVSNLASGNYIIKAGSKSMLFVKQ